MEKHNIKYYPVGNGDMSLIKIKSTKTILIDCNIRENSEDDMEDPKEVKEDLLNSIEERNGTPFIDVFALTHPDQDHCRGFENHFYTGNPNDYSGSHEEKEQIMVDELWVTRRLFHNGLCNDGNILRNEANRRKKLYDNMDPARHENGNRLVLIGHDGEEKFENVPHYYPGEVIHEIGGENQDEFSIFIHAPLKKDVVQGSAESDKNATSMVFQARFFDNKNDKENEEFACRALFGGDTDHYKWEKILEKTKKYENEESLKWDLFLAPHHCSWGFFNDRPYTGNPQNQTPKDYSLEVLDYGVSGAKIIASSVKIKSSKPNPPHQPSKDEYIKKVGELNFYNTATEPNEKNPKPIEFTITKNGAVKSPKGKMTGAVTSGGAGGAVATVNTTG